MSVNYDRVCRLCLSSRGELLPIFPTTSSDDSEPPVLATKIKDCVSVQISENDNLPTKVCRKCMDNVNNWHIFKSVCERTQNKLESLIKKDGNQLEEVKIKSEPLFDEAYDDGVVIDGSYPDGENSGSSVKIQPEGPPILASLGLTPRSDKKYVDPRMDWARVHAILDMVQEDDVIDSLQSTEESDILHHSDHDSDSEIDLKPDIADMYVDCKSGYICKDEEILSRTPKYSLANRVNKMKAVSTMRKRKLERPSFCPQPKNAWQKFFSEDLLELIVTSTNHTIEKHGHSTSLHTNIGELKTLIGILYLHGILRPTQQKFTDLWNSDCGVPCIKNAMKYDRIKFLLQNICFDKDADEDIMQYDIMRRMRKVFEIFAMNCRTAFNATGNVAVIDEILVPVYGPCPFRYNIDKKPLKSGMKLVLLVDPLTFFVNNLDVITDPYFESVEITKKLVQHLAGTGKTIVMDNWYMSMPLIYHLKNEYQLFSLAAISPKDDMIPPLFLSKYRKSQRLLTAFKDEDITLTSFVTMESKVMNVVTNEPQYNRKGHTQLSSAAANYLKYKSAVEVIDVLMNYYTTLQNTNDWTLSLFFTLLNIAAVNAQVMWSSQNLSNIVKRRDFLNELALSLISQREPASPPLLMEFSQGNKSSIFEKTSYKNRRRCKICIKTTKRDRRTKQYCMKCGQYICKEHTVFFCTYCNN